MTLPLPQGADATRLQAVGKKSTPRQKRNHRKAQKKETPQSRTNARSSNIKAPPPWQVRSAADAKENVEKEKERRRLVNDGIISSHETFVEESLPMLSKNFLQEPERRFISWKSFNPEKSSTGLKFIGGYLGDKPPRLGVPEVAFLGRSNVGKSSLLNRLASRSGPSSSASDQARVGKTPGATASVNLYALQDRNDNHLLGFVDLPGFGYAKLSKEVKASVQASAERYLSSRTELCLGILLVDIRRTPSDDDRAVLAALYDMGVPLVVVATKADKMDKKRERDACLEAIRDGLGLPEGQPLCVSSMSGEGCKPLWRVLLEACETEVEMKRSLYEGKEDEEQHNLEEFEDNDSYDQGYDWIHSGNG